MRVSHSFYIPCTFYLAFCANLIYLFISLSHCHTDMFSQCTMNGLYQSINV